MPRVSHPRALPPLLLASALSCQRDKAPERHYYDTHIQPLFDASCVGNTSPCHRVDPVTGTALGNLDLSSFEGVQKRRDVLRNYGAYPQPLLLLKAIPEESVLIPYAGKHLPTEIRHVGGKTLSPSADAFFELRRWIDSGATRDGVAPPPVARKGLGSCNGALPPGFDPASIDQASDAYRDFVAEVQPTLRASCAFGTCHGSPQADLYLTCGDDDAQLAANYSRAAAFVAAGTDSVDRSELLLRPLDPRAGGLSHTGGTFFPNRDDVTWKALRDFAQKAQAQSAARPLPEARPRSKGEAFFREHVMPVLLRRGCALETCHSPSGFNDFRLRPGAVGFLSALALRRNYETSLAEFMSLDTPDVRQSRLVKKNLFAENGGILHRGGALLEGPGPSSRAPCPPFDPGAATPSSAFCTLREWHRLEREEHAGSVSALGMGSKVAVAFIDRPADGDRLIDFDTYRGGAKLRLADATLGAIGLVESLDNPRDATGPCAGLAGDADVRGPEWSADGERLVFSARVGEAGGHDLWLLEPGKGTCRRLTSDNGRREGGVRVHNFDPVFAPDGALVFASTRAGTLTLKHRLPNADLWRVGAALDFGAAERMTVLTNSELGPAFMQNGQVSFTAEKASPDFYQLSGRRMNWDLTDYHPLLGQRAQSDDTFGMKRPSVGYQQATEIREGLDRDFLVILSDADARGAGGALGIFNRSIGPFEEGRAEKAFLPSLTLADPAAHGRVGTMGVYRSPVPLPDGQILASFAANVREPARDTPRYDLVAVEPRTGRRRMLLAGGQRSLVEAAIATKRSSRLLFRNLPQLVFGGHGDERGETATVHFPDLPMLATVLDANLRRGRNVEALAGARALAVYESLPPTSATDDGDHVKGPERVFTNRKLLGKAALESDGSLKVALPVGKPLVFELTDGEGKALLTMREEHQMGPGERITPGVPRKLWNGVCGGCHGSVSGLEPDVAVITDALTGASVSLSRDKGAKALQ
jgi:hypothetical protein